jgi:hypothetical protein
MKNTGPVAPHIPRRTPDKFSMGAFWTDAENIFETARQASQSGSPDCDWAILIGPQGDIRMLDACGWALPSLAAQHGAQTAYRVTREGGQVRLEGRRGSETCLLRSESPAATARHLLGCQFQPAGATAWLPPSPASLTEALPAPSGKDLWKALA